MDNDVSLNSLFFVLLVAAIAPIVAGLLPGPLVPQVVIFLVGGVLIGPEVLDLGSSSSLQTFSDVGLGFLFLLAGYEVDPKLVREPVMKLAGTAWFTSIAISLLVTGILYELGVVSDFQAVAIALTTTALGTILPIARDAGLLNGPLSRPLLANGAIGELGPIVAMAILLSASGRFIAMITLMLFGLLAGLLLVVHHRLIPKRISDIVARGTEETSQTTLRWVVVTLVGLLVVAGDLGLDIILGAFAAGVLLRLSKPSDIEALERKLDAVGYGFFIPIYFIVAGMNLDVDSIEDNPVPTVAFFVLMVLVRGGSVYLVHGSFPRVQRRQLALFSATSLPLLVALSQIGIESGQMGTDSGAALVGAGVLSVLILPLLAIRGKTKTTPDTASSAR